MYQPDTTVRHEGGGKGGWRWISCREYGPRGWVQKISWLRIPCDTLGESVFAVDVVAVGVPVEDSLSFSMLLRASHRLPSCFDSLETSTIGGRRAARKVTLYNGCDTGTESTGPEQTIDWSSGMDESWWGNLSILTSHTVVFLVLQKGFFAHLKGTFWPAGWYKSRNFWPTRGEGVREAGSLGRLPII